MITVTAALLEKDDTILIARKRPGLHLAGHWEFPGGKLEENETPEECLRRELLEEFGILCQIGKYIGQSTYDYGTRQIRLLGYKAHPLRGDFTPRDHDMIRWLTIEELVESIPTLCWAPADIPLVQQAAAEYFHNRTVSYYNANATEYTNSTTADDMQMIRRKFQKFLPPGGHILDVGCGSGRDVKAFREHGFTVTAIDASPAVAALTSSYLGSQVQVQKVQDLDQSEAYDGIWACASLLHLPEWELPEVLKRLAKALLPGGYCYMSFKRQPSPADAPRFFHYPKPEFLRKLLAECHELQLRAAFTSTSTKAGHQPERWFNIIVRKK